MGSKPRTPPNPPPVLPPNDDAKEALRRECEVALEKLLEREVGEGSSFEDYERAVLKEVHEIARRNLQKKLQTLADSFAPRLAIDHTTDWHGIREESPREYRRHSPGTVGYHSLVGPLEVRRFTYRERGSTSSYVPLELAAGLMERMTPALARCLAIGYAHMPPRTCEALMIAGCLRPPSRSTLDRTARDLGAYAVACNSVIEPLVRANEQTPAGTRLLVLGLDRVAVPMRHGEEFEGITAYSRSIRRSRPTPKPLASIQGAVDWRMDYVGTVAFFNEHKELLGSRKYRLPAGADVATIVERVMADVRHTLMQSPVEIAVVQDGAPELWTAITTPLASEPTVPRWTEVLDWYHLDERLTNCLDVCTTDATRELQRARWHAALLERNGGVRTVMRELESEASKAPTAAIATVLRGHAGYIARHHRRMHYRDYRACGIPIGSGVTEGACKSIVNVRAKRSGQRWSQRGVTAALHLRAMYESRRFDAFWSFFARRYRANIVPLGQESPRLN